MFRRPTELSKDPELPVANAVAAAICVGDTKVKFRERPFTVMKYLFWWLIH